MIHIIPINDLLEHEETGTMCHCGPEVDWSRAEAMVIHSALDDREDITTVPFSKGEWLVKRENQHK